MSFALKMAALPNIRGKPASVQSVQSYATYEQIMQAVPNIGQMSYEKEDINLLKNVVTTLENNPLVLFFIYRKHEHGVLLMYNKDKSIQMQNVENSSLETKLGPHAKDDHIYVFSYA